MDSARLFIAIDTPAEVKAQLVGLRDVLSRTGADVRWEQTEKLHCTLQFLGNVGNALFEPLCGAVGTAIQGSPPLLLIYRGMGFFPDIRRPRVVWAGIDDPEGTLLRVQRRIAESILPLGLRGEEQDFHPHVTLGRIRSARRLGQLIATAETCTFDHPPVTVREIDIVRSDLTARGSVYTVMRSFALTS